MKVEYYYYYPRHLSWFLKEEEVTITRFAHALFSTTVQNNISPLYAQDEQYARLTTERTPFTEHYLIG
jgi:hypothetical protein